MSSNFGIGGQEVKGDASEALNALPQNRTLLAGKLTPDTPVKPQIVEGLQTVEDVFEHFSPKIKIDFEDEQGGTVSEDIKFNNLGDFGKKGLLSNSDFLNDLNLESEHYKKMIKQLKTNKILKTALKDPETRQSVLETIQALIQEIEDAS